MNHKKLLILITIIISLSLTGCMGDYTKKEVLSETIKKKADGTILGKTTYKYDKFGRKTKMVEKEDGEIVRKLTWKFDNQGQVIEKYVFDKRIGYINRKDIRKFDSHGRKIEHKIIKESKDGDKKTTLYKYVYDNQDNLIEELTINPDTKQIIWRTIYDYNEAGKMILDKDYDEDGNEFKVQKWKFNQDGNEIYYYESIEGEESIERKTEYNKQGKKISYIKELYDEVEKNLEFVYDENGNEIKLISRDSKGRIKWIAYSKYDDKGYKIKEKRIYKNKDRVFIQRWSYDQAGNRTRYWGLENGKLDFEWIYKYEDNNLIYYEERDGNGNVENWKAYEWYSNGKEKLMNYPLIPSGRMIVTYDQEGNKIETIRKGKNGEIEYKARYEYNEKSLKKRLISYSNNDNIYGFKDYNYKDIYIIKLQRR